MPDCVTLSHAAREEQEQKLVRLASLESAERISLMLALAALTNHAGRLQFV